MKPVYRGLVGGATAAVLTLDTTIEEIWQKLTEGVARSTGRPCSIDNIP